MPGLSGRSFERVNSALDSYNLNYKGMHHIIRNMVQHHHVQGYSSFVEYMEQFKADDVVHVYFSGTKLPTGESWCDDCVRAWPVIEKSLILLNPTSHFVYVEVGDRPTWKDFKCPFRTDSSTKLMVLPTLLRWKGPQKLEGDQCEKADLVHMLFTDED